MARAIRADLVADHSEALEQCEANGDIQAMISCPQCEVRYVLLFESLKMSEAKDLMQKQMMSAYPNHNADAVAQEVQVYSALGIAGYDICVG